MLLIAEGFGFKFVFRHGILYGVLFSFGRKQRKNTEPNKKEEL
jgi:hypothetical protein